MHPLIKLTLISMALAAATLVTGCGESQAEKQAKERQRLEAEQQAARDLQKSNEAVTEVGKKLGRKVEPLDIGVPTGTTTAATTTSAAPPKKQ